MNTPEAIRSHSPRKSKAAIWEDYRETNKMPVGNEAGDEVVGYMRWTDYYGDRSSKDALSYGPDRVANWSEPDVVEAETGTPQTSRDETRSGSRPEVQRTRGTAPLPSIAADDTRSLAAEVPPPWDFPRIALDQVVRASIRRRRGPRSRTAYPSDLERRCSGDDPARSSERTQPPGLRSLRGRSPHLT
ncbi:MAG: hypothetical protein U5R31_07635 [Acidimicrobiia bacterium]|nr:hypothetical protein [Acidimicrobiia bacterium]